MGRNNRLEPCYVKNENGIPDAQRLHWDSAWVRAIGNPMAYDYGAMRDCWLSHFLTGWMGDDVWHVHQGSEIRKFNHVGDSHVITGEMVAKRTEYSRWLVDIEVRGTNQRGDITCPEPRRSLPRAAIAERWSFRRRPQICNRRQFS